MGGLRVDYSIGVTDGPCDLVSLPTVHDHSRTVRYNPVKDDLIRAVVFFILALPAAAIYSILGLVEGVLAAYNAACKASLD